MLCRIHGYHAFIDYYYYCCYYEVALSFTLTSSAARQMAKTAASFGSNDGAYHSESLGLQTLPITRNSKYYKHSFFFGNRA
jgi:hypothetical protein